MNESSDFFVDDQISRWCTSLTLFLLAFLCVLRGVELSIAFLFGLLWLLFRDSSRFLDRNFVIVEVGLSLLYLFIFLSLDRLAEVHVIVHRLRELVKDHLID